MKKQAVVILEPINHMFKVLQSAHERGYVAISMNSLGLGPSSPYESSVECVDAEYKIESWVDEAAVQAVFDEICSEYEVVGTYAGAEITLVPEAQLRRQLNLPSTSPDVVKRNLDKLQVRRLLVANGLSNLTTVSMAEAENLAGWPFGSNTCFFKPSSGAGSANVWQCKTMEDVNTCIEKWHERHLIPYKVLLDHIESTGQYFLEESASGQLFSVESIVCDGEVQVIGMTGRAMSVQDSAIEMGLFFPYQPKFEQNIVDKIVKIHQVMGITHGPTHAEVMVDDAGNIELVEMNLRFGGYDMLALISESLQLDFSEALLDAAIGQKPTLTSKSTQRAVGAAMFMPPKDLSTFESIEFPPEVIFSRLMKPFGWNIDSSSSQLDHVASCLFSAETYQKVLLKNDEIRQNTLINGRSIKSCQNNEIVT